MEKMKTWFGERENRILCLKLAMALLFPFLLCVLYCLKEGAWIGQLHFASAQNNDNLFQKLSLMLFSHYEMGNT